MRTRKVSFSSRNVRQMYLDAFPPVERMPFPVRVAMSKLWHTDFLAFYDGDTLCGFVYLAHNRKLVFIMFLAVYKMSRPNVQKILYKNVQLVCLPYVVF